MARRSSKKKSSVNPLKAVLITGAVLIVLMVVGLMALKAGIESWLRGDEFRDLVLRKVSVILKSEVRTADPQWQGSEIYLDSFVAKGYEDAGFAELSLDGARARIGGLEGGALVIPSVTANRFDIEFSERRLKRPPGEGVPADSSPSPQVPGWLKRFIPNRAEVKKVTLSSATVSVKRPDRTSPFSLLGTRAEIQPDFQTGMWEIAGSGGKILVANQPEVRLQDLKMRWRSRDLFIDRCSLGIYRQGHINGAGEISFEGEGSFDLDLDISGTDVDELVEGEWRERLSGTIEGPVRID
ncbi:MAG: hypothetical protein AAGC68_03065 [Verrucomicrobiota bacterium]